jgi:hypothetical protein
VRTPHDGDGVTVAELIAGENGTVALRGPMVPRHAFPPGIERSDRPHFAIRRDGLVDTGYPCRVDAATKTVAVTDAPPGIVSVGGYRLPLRRLLQTIGRIDHQATLEALPDALIGQRLVGNAGDPAAMQAALNAVGINPLVVAAFASRGEPAWRQALAVG